MKVADRYDEVVDRLVREVYSVASELLTAIVELKGRSQAKKIKSSVRCRIQTILLQSGIIRAMEEEL